MAEAAAIYGQLLGAEGLVLAAPPGVAAGLAVAYVLGGANEAAEALLGRCEAEEAAAAADWAVGTHRLRCQSVDVAADGSASMPESLTHTGACYTQNFGTCGQ